MQVKARLFKIEPFLMVVYKIVKDFWVSRLTTSLLCAHGNVHFDNKCVMLEIDLLGRGRDFMREQQKEVSDMPSVFLRLCHVFIFLVAPFPSFPASRYAEGRNYRFIKALFCSEWGW